MKFLLLGFISAAIVSGQVVCPRCQVEKIKSSITVGLCTSTALATSAHYDAEGVYHYHDPNKSGCSAVCSNGHTLTMSRAQGCPAGDLPSPGTTTEYARSEPPASPETTTFSFTTTMPRTWGTLTKEADCSIDVMKLSAGLRTMKDRRSVSVAQVVGLLESTIQCR